MAIIGLRVVKDQHDNIIGLGKVKEAYEADVLADWKLVNEMPVYVVIVHYETGNSYGRDEEIKTHIVEGFSNYDEAVALQTAIYEDQKRNKYESNSNSISCMKDGKEHKISTYTWNGYFEDLQYVEIEVGVYLENDDILNDRQKKANRNRYDY